MNCVLIPMPGSVQFCAADLACLRRCRCGGAAYEARWEFSGQGKLLSEFGGLGGGDTWEAQLCVGEDDGLGALPQERQPAFACRCGF